VFVLFDSSAFYTSRFIRVFTYCGNKINFLVMRDLSIKQKDFCVDCVKIASAYTRVVEGMKGAYVEFTSSCLNHEQIEVEPNEEFRLTNYWKDRAFCAWYRTKNSHKKISLRYKKVKYADYIPGMWYISINDVTFEGDLYFEKSHFPLD
jgi:hypothetical protein